MQHRTTACMNQTHRIVLSCAAAYDAVCSAGGQSASDTNQQVTQAVVSVFWLELVSSWVCGLAKLLH